mmetsp:Transcript_6853/g.15491  ORF Transcript_6853/g.15491 Transcript_6853/m.15491 type:complete len:252 (+) Transcript_6853:155-910(+)
MGQGVSTVCCIPDANKGTQPVEPEIPEENTTMPFAFNIINKTEDMDTEDATTADTVLGGSSPPSGKCLSTEDCPAFKLTNGTSARSSATSTRTSATFNSRAPAMQSYQSSGMPDFGGSWLCISVSGDMNKFLQDAGLGPNMCEAAQKADYGAGHQVQNIAQVGDAFVVQNIIKDPVTTRFRVGAGPQSTIDQAGTPVLIEPVWDGEMLCVTSKDSTGTLIATSRRYMDGDNMVLDVTSPQGAVVKRIFERR